MPEVMYRRNYITDQIKKIFSKFGFAPIETPAMEKLSVLTGKYGEEGDQLIFKILNSGNFADKVTPDLLADHKKLTPLIAEKALRYDLTVPFARFVVMNRNELTFPFRRYQIQPVWRGDNPQKGRYREFYQCDADIVGTDSLLCEAEIILMLEEAFSSLNIKDYTVKINNRKILTGISKYLGQEGRETDLCIALDKLDKTSKEVVLAELKQKGFGTDSLNKLNPLFALQGSIEEKLKQLKEILSNEPEGIKGLEEVEEVFSLAKNLGSNLSHIDFDITLARGLSYYTGAIFEVKAGGVSIGSISGGGRYDNLTGLFGLQGVSGIGISFGIDRIYDVMNELNLFQETDNTSTKLLIAHFDQATFSDALKLITFLRQKGINAEVYPDQAKLKKQMTYANSKKIPFVIIVGPEEMETGIYTLKNMLTGDQDKLNRDQISHKLKT